VQGTDSQKPILIFLGFLDENYSRSAVLLNYPSPDYEKKFYKVPTNIISAARFVLNLKRSYRNRRVLFVIMSPCHKLTLPTRLITKQKIILDAGWPLSDGELSRPLRWQSFISLPKAILIDLVSLHSANLILVETEHQKLRVARLFKISLGRIMVSYTGFNESKVNSLLTDSTFQGKLDRHVESFSNKKVVIFRGKVNSESGYARIIQAARILEDKAIFLLLVNQNNWTGSTPTNCYEINSFTDEQMHACYRVSQIALGQISDHKRLNFTIPHKAYEAGFFGVAYLTSRSAGIEEFGTEDQLTFLDSLSPEKIAEQILEMIKSGRDIPYGKSLSRHYQSKYSQPILNHTFELMLKRVQLE
jgi:hypothetical protein